MSKSNGEKLRELYLKAAETSLLILNEAGTDIMRTSTSPEEPTSTEQPLRSKRRASTPPPPPSSLSQQMRRQGLQ